MFGLTYTAEDTTIMVRRDALGRWTGVCVDGPTGKDVKVEWSDEELNAILALATHPDGMPLDAEVTNKFYTIAEPAMERGGMDKDGQNIVCRPIP